MIEFDARCKSLDKSVRRSARHCYEEKRGERERERERERKMPAVSSGALCCTGFIPLTIYVERPRKYPRLGSCTFSRLVRGSSRDSRETQSCSMHRHVIERIASPREQATEGKPGTLRRCIMCMANRQRQTLLLMSRVIRGYSRGCEWARTLEITTRKMLACAVPSPSLSILSSLSLSLWPSSFPRQARATLAFLVSSQSGSLVELCREREARVMFARSEMR